MSRERKGKTHRKARSLDSYFTFFSDSDSPRVALVATTPEGEDFLTQISGMTGNDVQLLSTRAEHPQRRKKKPTKKKKSGDGDDKGKKKQRRKKRSPSPKGTRRRKTPSPKSKGSRKSTSPISQKSLKKATRRRASSVPRRLPSQRRTSGVAGLTEFWEEKQRRSPSARTRVQLEKQLDRERKEAKRLKELLKRADSPIRGGTPVNRGIPLNLKGLRRAVAGSSVSRGSRGSRSSSDEW